MAGVWENFQPDLNNNGETKKFFKNTMEHIFGGLLLNWVGSSADQITKYNDELCDDYYLLRKSVRAPEAIVRSECKIEWTSPKDLKVTHWHHDRYDEIRTSKGFMVPTDGNHIAVLNIENGLSIEFLAVKKPPTERFKRLIGFIVTINSNGVLISARVSLIKKRELSFEPPIRFRFDAYDEDVVMKKTIKFLSSDEAMTIPDWTSQLYSEIEKDDGKKGK
jgi:hypothetical protein